MAAAAALLSAAPDARAQICFGTNCPKAGAGANAGGQSRGGAQGGAQGSVVWNPFTGQWIPQWQGSAQGNAGGQAQGHAGGYAQGQAPVPPPPPPPSVPPPPPSVPPPPPPPPSYGYSGGEPLPPRYFEPYFGLGGCLGMQMGIADSEVRMALCARQRLQPWKYVGFGNDLTYSFGADDKDIPAPLQAYRHELGAWPYISIHPINDGLTPYLRLGPSFGVAPMVGDGWSETRTYAGGHVGIGFDATSRGGGATVGLEMLGFVVTRLDDSPRPDGAEGRGGFGAQIRFSVGAAWLL